MFSWFKKKEPTTHVFEPSASAGLFKPTTGGFRSGMWVVSDSSVGILHKFVDASTAELHYVSIETGETALIEQVSLNGLRQAKWNEIPQVRRHFDRETARSLGYGD